MLTQKQLIAALDALRGAGAWRRIASVAGCDYNTLARIARGEQMPRADLLERLSNAIADMPAPAKAEA